MGKKTLTVLVLLINLLIHQSELQGLIGLMKLLAVY